MSSARNDLVLLTSVDDDLCSRAVQHLGGARVVRDEASLRAAQGTVLLTFGTSFIVPRDLIARFSTAFNLHPASPSYPGRDPHHWAVYDRASRYGATLHEMTERVDEGAIVDVDWFDVTPGTAPDALLAAANDAALRILMRVGGRLHQGGALDPLLGVQWSGIKRSRKDLLAICEIDAHISQDEFEHRLFAFSSAGYNNLVTRIHGHTFRIE